MNLLYSVDVLEGGTALLVGDDESELRICASQLSPEVREGDLVAAGSDGIYRPDPEATQARRARILELYRSLGQ